MGDGDSSNLVEIKSNSYSYLTNGFLATISLADETMTAGRFYQFSYTAINSIDTSEASHIVTVPAADYPEAPANLVRVASTRNSISVVWDEVADTQLPAGLTTGYSLYIDNGLHGDFILIYDGEGVPTVRHFEAKGLVTGRHYRFYVISTNHVGHSAASSIVSIYACENPSDLSAPEKISISKTSVTVSWKQPGNDGGCPITGYALFRDGGPLVDSFTEVHASNVNNKRALNIFTITDLPVGIVGKELRIKV